MTRRISLGGLGGMHVALVDDEDYELVNRYHWTTIDKKGDGQKLYAVRSYRINGRRYRQSMHTLIMSISDDLDHIDHNGLNNQRNNLRIATIGQNARNRQPMKGGSSKYKGVDWFDREQAWRARITTNGHVRFIGNFSSETEAALAYDIAAEVEHGEYASLNRNFFSELNVRN